jgi:DNA-directed RNA polymerase I subunit RPA2
MINTLPLMIANLSPGYFEIEGQLITVTITAASISKPEHPRINSIGLSDVTLFPSECRARATSYSANFSISYKISSNDVSISLERQSHLPIIMLKSNRCNLRSLNPLQLIQHQEEPEVFNILSFL